MSPSRPRICVVTPVHWKAFMGGAQYQIKCLLDHLVSLDRYDIHYLARRVPDDRHLDGYTIHRIGDGGPMPRFGYITDAPALYRALSDLRPAVIYQRVGCAYTGICAYYAGRRNARLVWHAASDSDLNQSMRVSGRNFIRAFFEASAISYGIRHADRVVVQTNHQAQLLYDKFARPADAVIRNFHPHPTEACDTDEPLRIVWIANFKRLKQPEAFIRLAESLRDLTEVRFVMIGSPAMGGDSVRWNEALSRRIAATPNLTYLGQLNQEGVNAQLDGAYVFVNTSLYEGFPNTFIQAWFRGVPVVSLNVNPDGVFDSEAIGMHAGTEERMTEVIRHLVENRTLRDRLAGSATDHARQFHSMQNAVKLAQVIEGALRGGHA
jgi:glycosyltransferase involved in cell wall biosynthesis